MHCKALMQSALAFYCNISCSVVFFAEEKIEHSTKVHCTDCTNLCLCSLTVLFREFRMVGSWVMELLRLSLKLTTLFRWTCLRSKDDPKDLSLEFKVCFELDFVDDVADSRGSNRKSGLVFCRWGRFSSLRVGWLQPLNLSLKLSSMKCLNSMS